MKWHCRFCTGVIIFFACAPSFSQSSRPTISKQPAWVIARTIDYNKTALDKEASDGCIDMAYEMQVSLEEKSSYFRYSKKIISAAGVQNGSMLSISFDPSYQQLIFHTIEVIRKGQVLNRLQLSKIKTTHRERELTDFIYDGSLEAVLILDDTRPGDIIEYSYSIRGFNPVFKNKYSEQLEMNFAVPVYNLYYRLLVPPGRQVNIKNLNDTCHAVGTNINGQQVYEWHKENVSPLVLQDLTPSWYNPYGEILISEFKSWKEVNDWAMELFPVNIQLSPAIQKKITEIVQSCAGDNERTMAALRFVQDDIRYMGIEMGENSHRPASPSKIFNQRFGDCKEKSYLLCCMLAAMHINANPVLINTTAKNALTSWLPAPTNFNHTTVRVQLDGAYYWFDPTIAYQRGNIKDLFYPDYQVGLVIADTTASLSNITFRNLSYQYINDYFKVRDLSGSGTLVVSTAFKGNEADAARNRFNNESITATMADNQKFYAHYYDDIQADSLTYTDNDSTGVFTSMEYYTIPAFWSTKNGRTRFAFSPFIIDNIIRRPKQKERKMPFRLAFPVKYQEKIVIALPNNWNVIPEELHLKNDGFAYNSKFYSEYNEVYLKTDYENTGDHVSSDASSAYFKSINEYDDKENYELSSDTNNERHNSPVSGSSTVNILSIIIFAVLITFVLMRWSRPK